MLASIIGNYLDNLSEREFDSPFLEVLSRIGFYDIHFLHGSFEFGKDFIAKKVDGKDCFQYAFQTKRGNVGLNEWNDIRGQLDLLCTDSHAHPNFDRQLPLKARLATTGRLVGGGALAAQEYREFSKKQFSVEFTVWDREYFVELLQSDPEVGFAGSVDGTLLTLLGKIDEKNVCDVELEQYSRKWLNTGLGGLWRFSFECILIANRLKNSGRIDLSCYIVLCLQRAAWFQTHGNEPPISYSVSTVQIMKELFRCYAFSHNQICQSIGDAPQGYISSIDGPTSFVTYPVRCLRTCEILGLLGLLEFDSGSPLLNDLHNFLKNFFSNNPGAVHPISDRWAISLVPPLLFLAKMGNMPQIESILKDVIRWIGDRYENESLGLAGPTVTPEEEVSYLLGTPFEHVALNRRLESYVATIVLDLCAIFRLGSLYELARNEFLAVGALPCLVEVNDSTSQYLLNGPNLSYETNLLYQEKWTPTAEWKAAAHHNRNENAFYLDRLGQGWDQLALSCVLRDRHSITGLERYFRNS